MGEVLAMEYGTPGFEDLPFYYELQNSGVSADAFLEVHIGRFEENPLIVFPNCSRSSFSESIKCCDTLVQSSNDYKRSALAVSPVTRDALYSISSTMSPSGSPLPTKEQDRLY